MTHLRVLPFLLLVLGVSDRVFACESKIGLDGETYQICHHPGEFRAAARAAGVTDLGIETFESVRWPLGLYPSGVFDLFHDEPFGAWFGASGGPSSTVEIGQSTSLSKFLRGQSGFYNLQLGFGPYPDFGSGPRHIRAIGFDFFAEPVGSFTPTSIIVRLGSLACCGEFGLGSEPIFIGIVSTRPFNVVTLQATQYGTMILDNIEYSGGPASEPGNPYPPELCPPSISGWCFDAQVGPAWYDPTPTTGYEFFTLDGSFTAIDDFPPGFGDAFTVSEGGTSLGRFSPGQRVAFPAGVTQFRITGITPAVDAESPTAFPIKLSLDTVGATFVMRPLTDDDAVDTTPAQVACQGSDGLWHGSDVSIACTASDSGSGLANAADASFMLATNVPAGTETANAESNQHTVCDVAGNCATAGPVAGNKVDTKAPAITITGPSNTSYLVNQSVAADYSCSDGGSGVVSCLGPVVNGGAVRTAVPGNLSFAVNAADAVGNRSNATVNYFVTYGIRALYDEARAFKSSSTVPITLQLVDANGADVSSQGVVVNATSLSMRSTSVVGTPADAGNANPDSNFRFDPTLGSTGGYIFNLQTKGLAPGVYALSFAVTGDPIPHQVQLQVK